MYYNPKTKEIISHNELKCRLHASIPELEEEVGEWHLIHNGDAPIIQNGQSIVPDEIKLQNGKYVQTWKSVGKIQESSSVMLEDRISAIESGLIEIAKLMSEGRT